MKAIRLHFLLLFYCLQSTTTLLVGQYTDITPSAEIQHYYVNTSFLGGGVAFIDYDRDGWQDIAMTGGELPDRLYRNLSDGTYEDVSHLLSKHDDSHVTSAIVSGDLNNDDCDDLVIVTSGLDDTDIILQNNCDGTFTLVDSTISLTQRGNSMAITLFDFDGDGLLDVYVGNYVREIRNRVDDDGKIIGYDHVCDTNALYLNRGDFHFEEATQRYGVAGQGCTLASTVVPLSDGSFGLFNANDFGPFLHPNELFVIDDGLPLSDEAASYRLDKAIYGMGIAIGDIDDDQDFDLYIANLGENILHVNDGSIYFEAQKALRIDNTNTPDDKLTTSWGTFFLDVDLDRDLDLFVANGTVNSASFVAGSYDDPNQLFLNQGRAFVATDERYGIVFQGANIHRGAAMADLDNDGDLDIVTAYVNFEPTDKEDRRYRLYRNDQSEGHHYLKIDLHSTLGSSNAFGAKVYLYGDDKVLSRYHYSGGTHASQNELGLHFGLGDMSQIDSVVVEWPHGETMQYYDISADKYVRLIDDGSLYVLGCMDEADPLYDPQATFSQGCTVDLSTSVEYVPMNDTDISWEILPGHLSIHNKSGNRATGALYTVDGQLLRHIPTTSPDESILMSTVGLPTGLYLLHMRSGDRLLSAKIFLP